MCLTSVYKHQVLHQWGQKYWKPMSLHCEKVILEFCKLCNSAYEAAAFHRLLFDENPIKEQLQSSFANEALSKLCEITQEYALLQIVKLHDAEMTSGKLTLGIDYIIKSGGWSEPEMKELKKLETGLVKFARKLRKCRNKTLSHNDLVSILCGETIGAFSKNEDVAYFDLLQEFVNTVHDLIIGGPYPFNDIVKNDINAFNIFLKKAL